MADLKNVDLEDLIGELQSRFANGGTALVTCDDYGTTEEDRQFYYSGGLTLAFGLSARLNNYLHEKMHREDVDGDGD